METLNEIDKCSVDCFHKVRFLKKKKMHIIETVVNLHKVHFKKSNQIYWEKNDVLPLPGLLWPCDFTL